MASGRSVLLGIYNTDGDLISGELPGFRDTARRLAESNVSLFLQFRGEEALFGTAVNVQRSGRRPDTVIVLIRALPVRYTRETGRLVILLYREAITSLESADYRILNIGNDEELIRAVRAGEADGRRKVAFESRSSEFVAGKLVATQTAVVVSRNLRASVAHVAAVVDILVPVLRLGYTFSVSKKTFDANLSILPDKPPNVSAVDVELDNQYISRASADGDVYRRFVDALSDPGTTAFNSKNELSRGIATTIYKKTRDRDFKQQYLRMISAAGLPVDVDVDDAVASVIQQKRTALFEQYLKSRRFNRSSLRDALARLSSADSMAFWEVLAQAPAPYDRWRQISDLLQTNSMAAASFSERFRDPASRTSAPAAAWSSVPAGRRNRRWPLAVAAIIVLCALVLSLALLTGLLPAPVARPNATVNGDEALRIVSPDGIAGISTAKSAVLGLSAGEELTIQEVTPPQDFVAMGRWKPIGLFYLVSPEASTFDPPARFAIIVPANQSIEGSTIIARNIQIGGDWEQLETHAAANGTVTTSIPSGGLYGVFAVPVPAPE
ncbi:MAG: hypothetical protein GKC04_07710 [Methanomicrobiales archaeon]|nr:hypothetical protein [Methanomicrobiales archaeon]